MSNKHHPCRLKNVPDQKENIGNVLKSTSVPTSFIKDLSVLIKGIDGWKSDEHFQQNYFYGFIVEGGKSVIGTPSPRYVGLRNVNFSQKFSDRC